MRSLRNRLWLGFGSLLLIVLAVSTLSVAVLTRYSHALERVFSENYDSALYCNSMKESLDQLNQRAERLIWQEPAARKIDFTVLEGKFQDALLSQLNNCTLRGEADASNHLATLWQNYRDRYRAFNDAPAVDPALYEHDLLPRYDELKGVAQQIADMNMSNMISVDGQAKQTLVAVRNSLLILVTAGTALAALVVWTATAAILRPLKDLTLSVRQIEAGNLDLNLVAASRDEIGNLASAFNSMTSRLREFKQLDHDKLFRSRQTMQLAIDSLPDAVFVIGPDERIEISNEAARSYFGIEPGREVSSLGLNWLPVLYDEVKNHRTSVEPRGYKSAIQLFVNGEERFLLPHAVRMISPDHREVGVTAILVDVTQLRRVDEAKSNLVSTVSHELRTPLTSQRLLLGLLITSTGNILSPAQKRMLEVAKADSDRLYRTIDDLLSLSRMESGRAQFQFRPMSPRGIVLSCVDPLRPLFSDKNVRLNVTAPEDLSLVRADPVSINSALTNLLSNALKFTPAGGDVTVTAEEQLETDTKTAGGNGSGSATETATRTTGAPAIEGARSTESARDTEGARDTESARAATSTAGPAYAVPRIQFTVTDTGPGIPSQFRARIFEKFFRVPASIGPSGAGLGLSITKNIIEAHGGHIRFDCPEGGGTIFRFDLPLSSRLVAASA